VAADLGGEGFEALAELVDLDGEAGEAQGVALVLAVLVDDGAQFGVAVEVERPMPERAATSAMVTGWPAVSRSWQACSTRAARWLVMRPGSG